MTLADSERRGDAVADVIVVGAGGSGMTAAASAAALGLKVIVVEKDAKVGGTTGLSVGSIMAAGGAFQKRAGIEDSPADHARDLDAIRTTMGAQDDPELRALLTENVADTVEFLRSIGVNFLAPLPQPPHTKSRLHQVMPTSRAYVQRLHRLCRQLGVEIRLGTPLTRIVVENGRVGGIEARSGNRDIRLTARRGVVLASGDLGGNNQLMHKYLRNWVPGIEVYNPNNTGDGHVAAAAVGGHIVPRKDLGAEMSAAIRFVKPRDSLIQKIPPYPSVTRALILAMKVLPDWLIRPFMMKFLTTTLGPDRIMYQQGAILVNMRGERFADELNAPNVLIPQQPDGLAYLVFDERFAQKFRRWPYFISTAPGVAFAYLDDYRAARPDLFNRAPSIEALAARLGMPPDGLARTIAETNRAREPEMQLLEAPFYALGPVKTWVLIGPVGLSVNTRLQVLDEAGAAIPGLYAVGQVAQGAMTLSGHGHGLGWAFTSGRLVARSLAGARAAEPPNIRAAE
ncbi:MAG: FAD-dependent oxidoreductase [Rhizomicrobium sp.]